MFFISKKNNRAEAILEENRRKWGREASRWEWSNNGKTEPKGKTSNQKGAHMVTPIKRRFSMIENVRNKGNKFQINKWLNKNKKELQRKMKN